MHVSSLEAIPFCIKFNFNIRCQMSMILIETVKLMEFKKKNLIEYSIAEMIMPYDDKQGNINLHSLNSTIIPFHLCILFHFDIYNMNIIIYMCFGPGSSKCKHHILNMCVSIEFLKYGDSTVCHVLF